MPSRLKGIETLGICYQAFLVNSSHVPSRLKGIETWYYGYEDSSEYLFTRAFPFEGNWNCLKVLVRVSYLEKFTRAFPFEGNWNKVSNADPLNFYRRCSHVPSRLKGIETWFSYISARSFNGSHVPSRLKGIETKIGFCWKTDKLKCFHLFTRAFPFEGNWNMASAYFCRYDESTSSHVPSRLKGIETFLLNFLIRLEFWFTRAFPFEGNWNKWNLCCRSRQHGSHVPSRLKGIETCC